MLITGGKFKSRKISTIRNNIVRPTSNKVRQSIFNVLIHRFEFNNWRYRNQMLDAFAGSGIISFESISRNIRKSTLIEEDDVVYKNILINVRELNLEDKVTIFNKSFFDIISFDTKFKLFYLDPPYYKNLCNTSLEKIFDEKLYKKKAIIVCETEKSFKFNLSFKKYLIFNKIYGSIKISYLLTN